MITFDYLLPTRLVFGRGRLNELGGICAEYGKKPLIVTGKSSAKTGLLGRITAQLSDCAVFDEVVQNPLSTTAEAGLAALRRQGCDMVLAVGGGSPMDTAKAIAFMAKNEGDINDYIMQRKTGEGALPVVTVSTTAGTGSEANCFAVLTNPATNDKKSLKNPAIFPKVAILDPELLTSQPPHIVASTGFDAFSHNLEAYIANRAQPIVRILAAQGIRLLFENLEKAYQNPTDVDAFDQVMLASTLGGMSICLAGVGLPHAMEHPVSGLYNVVHGQGLAAILPKVMRFNAQRAPERLAALAVSTGITSTSADTDKTALAVSTGVASTSADTEKTALTVSTGIAGNSASTGEAALALCNKIDKLLYSLNLRFTLSQLGVLQKDVAWLAHNAMTLMNANAVNNPYVPTEEDVYALFESCL